MPYNSGTGVYTLPAVYLAVPGTTILATQHNTPLEDLEVANNYARPIVAGGTGQNSAVLARGSTGLATMGNIGVKGANIASAAALALVADFNYFHVTGVVTVTSISTRPAGERIVLEFEGALILTHNATSLILPGAVNITTAAGDVAEFISEGSGNWRCASYTKASGAPITIRPPTQQEFTASGTWTKPVGCVRAVFEACGGGGGSGGVNGNGTGTGATAGGGSGFSGSTGIINVTATASAGVTIGAGGTAGDLNTNGGSGGFTRITIGATVYTWGGGVGSDFFTVSTSVGSVEGGAGGVGTNVTGFSQQGGIAARSINTDNNVTSGSGGSSLFGTGGLGRHSITPGAAVGGLSGTGFGAGASGAFNNGPNTDQNGAAGTGGYMRVTEYYN